MRPIDVGTERDVCHPWVIQIDAMNVDQARRFGKMFKCIGLAIGLDEPLTGRFIDGETADLVIDGAKWRKEHGRNK